MEVLGHIRCKKREEEYLAGVGGDNSPIEAYRAAANQPNRLLTASGDIFPFLLLHSPLDALKVLGWETAN